MSKFKGAIIVDENRCKGCSLCVATCPQGVIALAQKSVNINGYRFCQPINMNNCVGCAMCGIVCPDSCIAVYKKRVDD